MVIPRINPEILAALRVLARLPSSSNAISRHQWNSFLLPNAHESHLAILSASFFSAAYIVTARCDRPPPPLPFPRQLPRRRCFSSPPMRVCLQTRQCHHFTQNLRLSSRPWALSRGISKMGFAFSICLVHESSYFIIGFRMVAFYGKHIIGLFLLPFSAATAFWQFNASAVIIQSFNSSISISCGIAIFITLVWNWQLAKDKWFLTAHALSICKSGIQAIAAMRLSISKGHNLRRLCFHGSGQ